jgi:hypothetical protein
MIVEVLIIRLKFTGNKFLFQQERSLQDRRKILQGRVIPVQNEKALFFQCHIVVLAVKLIYGTGIVNDVMDGED